MIYVNRNIFSYVIVYYCMVDSVLNSGLVNEWSLDFGKFCRDLLDCPIKPFHEEWAHIFDTEKLSAFYAPRGYWKSSILGVNYPLWKIRFSEFNGGPWYFGVISDSLPQSGEVFRRIRRILDNNPYFHDLVPPPTSNLSYNTRALELTNGSIIYCFPYSRTAVGKHVHRFFFDEASKVPDTRLFWEDLTPMVNHYDGNICLAGTPDHVNDCIDQCFSNDKFFTKTYRAIDDLGQPLWPEKFDLEKLAMIRESKGATSFARNYMCKLVDSGTQVFSPELLASRSLTNQEFQPTPKKEWIYFVGVDLALSKQGDFMVITTVGLDNKTGLVSVVDIRKTRGTDYEVQKIVLTEVYNTYKPVRVLVDDSVYGEVFINELIHKYYVPAEGYNFQPQKRTALLNNLVAYFPKVCIPRKDVGGTNEMTNELLYELSGLIYGQTRTGLRSFECTTEHDDMIMSLGLAMFGVKDYGEVSIVTEEDVAKMRITRKAFIGEDEDILQDKMIFEDSTRGGNENSWI